MQIAQYYNLEDIDMLKNPWHIVSYLMFDAESPLGISLPTIRATCSSTHELARDPEDLVYNK